MPRDTETRTATRSADTWLALLAPRAREANGTLTEIMAASSAPGVISFSGGFPDPSTFPWETLPAVLADLAAGRDWAAFQYSPVAGLDSTRAYLRTRVEALEGVSVEEGELLVTSGGIDALQCLGRAFLTAGDGVVVERPTYLGALMGFRSAEARIEPIGMDGEGFDVDALERLLGGGFRPKLLYTIPDHQNPMGVSMAADRRVALVELARRYGFLVVEDIAYRELAFGDEPKPHSLWALAPDVVLQIGTFSKLFLPGVRLGWALGPASVVDGLVWAKQLSDQGAGALGQRLLEEHGRRGLLDDQIERSRSLYRHRWDLVRESLVQQLEPHAEWTTPTGGFFTWLTLRADVDSVELSRQAWRAGIAFVPGVPFFSDGGGRGNVRLSFSQVSEQLIEDGVAQLANLIQTSEGGR